MKLITLSRAVVWTVLLAGFLLAGPLLWAQSDWQAPPESENYEKTVKAGPESSAAGKKVYEKYCLLCHGAKGDGKGASARTFEVAPADFTDKAAMKQSDGSLAWKILAGRGPMPPWGPVLKEKDIWDVIHYIRDFSK